MNKRGGKGRKPKPKRNRQTNPLFSGTYFCVISHGWLMLTVIYKRRVATATFPACYPSQAFFLATFVSIAWDPSYKALSFFCGVFDWTYLVVVETGKL